MAELQAITPRAYELIRNRIGSILADELPKQSVLNSDTRLNSTVYIERFTPVGDEEVPLIIVSLSDTSFGLDTSLTIDGEYTFFIDCYEKAKSNALQSADERANFRLQRIAGVVHGILSDNKYRTLGFQPPFIENVTTRSIKIADPKNSMDASSVVMARIEFTVRATNSKQKTAPLLIDGYTTQAILGLTSLGYTYGTHQMTAPESECEDAHVQLNGIDISSVESGTFINIPVIGTNGAVVGCWNGSSWVVPTDSTFNYSQGVASDSWLITHNLGKFPSVSVVDNGNTSVEGETTYIDINSLIINFSSAFSGEAYLN